MDVLLYTALGLAAEKLMGNRPSMALFDWVQTINKLICTVMYILMLLNVDGIYGILTWIWVF